MRKGILNLFENQLSESARADLHDAWVRSQNRTSNCLTFWFTQNLKPRKRSGLESESGEQMLGTGSGRWFSAQKIHIQLPLFQIFN